MERPKTKTARSGDLHIAYQVVAQGPMDLVKGVPGTWQLYEVAN